MSLQIRTIMPILQPRPKYRSGGSLRRENWAAFVVTLADFSMSNLGGLFRAWIIPRFSRTSLNGGSKNEREEKSQPVITPNYTLMIAQEQPQGLPFWTVYQGENKLCCVLSQFQNASRTSTETAAAIYAEASWIWVERRDPTFRTTAIIIPTRPLAAWNWSHWSWPERTQVWEDALEQTHTHAHTCTQTACNSGHLCTASEQLTQVLLRLPQAIYWLILYSVLFSTHLNTLWIMESPSNLRWISIT